MTVDELLQLPVIAEHHHTSELGSDDFTAVPGIDSVSLPGVDTDELVLFQTIAEARLEPGYAALSVVCYAGAPALILQTWSWQVLRLGRSYVLDADAYAGLVQHLGGSLVPAPAPISTNRSIDDLTTFAGLRLVDGELLPR